MAWCKCYERPKCERGCCDQWADVSDWQVDWTKMRRPFTMEAARQAARPIFMCWACYDSFVKSSKRKAWPGIDRPDYASDDWRPSILHHISMMLIEEKISRRHEKAHPAPDVAQEFRPVMPHELRWNPQQRAAMAHVRRVMRENG